MPDPLLIPYRELGFGGARPYLFLHVTGLDGHGRADLDLVEGTQVGGSVTLRRATRPSTAYIPEFPDLTFDMAPFFVHGCQHALWGRADLMRHFDVTIRERHQQVLLTPATDAA